MWNVDYIIFWYACYFPEHLVQYYYRYKVLSENPKKGKCMVNQIEDIADHATIELSFENNKTTEKLFKETSWNNYSIIIIIMLMREFSENKSIDNQNKGNKRYLS